jgi:hypothetical protein
MIFVTVDDPRSRLTTVGLSPITRGGRHDGRHGRAGSETNVDLQVMEESLRNTGATVMGRRMFSGGQGAWEYDPNADAWWGEDPPFRHPVFILTHHAREPVARQGGTTFTFVTAGIEAALERAQAAAAPLGVQAGDGGQRRGKRTTADPAHCSSRGARRALAPAASLTASPSERSPSSSPGSWPEAQWVLNPPARR